MNDPSPPSRAHAAIVRNRAYAAYPQRQLELLMDIYRPDTDDDVPVVLWFHDGGWRAGSKDHCPIRWLVRYGYAVATANYRLLPADHYPAQLHDARAAVRFLRGHAAEFGLNPAAIAAAGASTGAYLALMLGVAAPLPEPDPAPEPAEHHQLPADVQTVINFFGFSDFPALQGLPSRRDNAGLTSPEARFLGTPPRLNPKLAAEASPITHIRPGVAPVLHLHGEANDVVPLDQSRRFHDALRVQGIPTKLVLLKGLGHHGSAIYNHEAARGRVVDFLHLHLAGSVPAAARFHGQRPKD